MITTHFKLSIKSVITFIFVFLIPFIFYGAELDGDEQPLMRFPDIHKDVAKLYSLTLKESDKPLLPFQNNKVDDESKTQQEETETPAKVSIDFEGIHGRVEELPLENGNIRHLSMNDNTLFYLNKEDGDFNRFEFRGVSTMNLYAFDFDKREFRELRMGPIIGTRTWGGLVGVSQFIPLIDGGILTAPDYRIYDKQGNWIIENKGVKPDIHVELNSEKMKRAMIPS